MYLHPPNRRNVASNVNSNTVSNVNFKLIFRQIYCIINKTIRNNSNNISVHRGLPRKWTAHITSCATHSHLSCERRRMQNNVTRRWGEWRIMQGEYDQKHCYSLFVSYYSLYSRQWHQGINNAVIPCFFFWTKQILQKKKLLSSIQI